MYRLGDEIAKTTRVDPDGIERVVVYGPGEEIPDELAVELGFMEPLKAERRTKKAESASAQAEAGPADAEKEKE